MLMVPQLLELLAHEAQATLRSNVDSVVDLRRMGGAAADSGIPRNIPRPPPRRFCVAQLHHRLRLLWTPARTHPIDEYYCGLRNLPTGAGRNWASFTTYDRAGRTFW